MRRLRPLALAPLLAAACAAPPPAEERVVDLVRDEQYVEAVALAEELAEERPSDARAARMLREARLALQLQRGRVALFDGRVEDALEHFVQASEIDPESAVVRDWIVKTRRQLTRTWLDTAVELVRLDDLEGALDAYRIALHYTPGHPDALSGASRVLLLMNYRMGMGETYYDEGVRAVHEHFLPRARTNFAYTEKYTPDDERAALRKQQVEEALAEQRLVVARGFEERGLYPAAMNEYRLVMLLDPTSREARAGRDRMAREVEALRLRNEADMLIRQERLGEALDKLERGRELTRLQTDAFTRLLNEIEVVRWESLYRRGVDLERDYRYEEAAATYQELLDEAEFYEDAEQRLRTLREFVARAEELYARAMATEDPAERRLLLREISIFWPEYRDVPQLLAELEG